MRRCGGDELAVVGDRLELHALSEPRAAAVSPLEPAGDCAGVLRRVRGRPPVSTSDVSREAFALGACRPGPGLAWPGSGTAGGACVWTSESNCAYGNALRLSPSPFGSELGALRAYSGARRRHHLEQAPRLRHHPCGLPSPVPRGRRRSGHIGAANGQKRVREGRVCSARRSGRRQTQTVGSCAFTLGGPAWCMHHACTACGRR